MAPRELNRRRGRGVWLVTGNASDLLVSEQSKPRREQSPISGAETLQTGWPRWRAPATCSGAGLLSPVGGGVGMRGGRGGGFGWGFSPLPGACISFNGATFYTLTTRPHANVVACTILFKSIFLKVGQCYCQFLSHVTDVQRNGRDVCHYPTVKETKCTGTTYKDETFPNTNVN